MKRIVLILWSCVLLSCSNLKLKEPVYRKNENSVFVEIAQLAPFEKIAIKTTSEQKNGRSPFYEIDVTLDYGHVDSLSNEALQSLAETVNNLLNREIVNIQEYTFINVIFKGEVDKFEIGQTQKNIWAFIPRRSK